EPALRQGLARLQAAEFLYETSLFPDLEYTFKHALTHEVAYGSLLQERRRHLHARVVAAYESLYPDRLAEQVERLAGHALQAGLWDKAVEYCWQAGDRAVSRSAHVEAITHYDRALTALGHLPDTLVNQERAVDIRVAIRNALLPLGEWKRSLEYLREALVTAEVLADQRRIAQVSAQMITALSTQGDFSGAIAVGERALTAATAPGLCPRSGASRGAPPPRRDRGGGFPIAGTVPFPARPRVLPRRALPAGHRLLPSQRGPAPPRSDRAATGHGCSTAGSLP